MTKVHNFPLVAVVSPAMYLVDRPRQIEAVYSIRSLRNTLRTHFPATDDVDGATRSVRIMYPGKSQIDEFCTACDLAHDYRQAKGPRFDALDEVLAQKEDYPFLRGDSPDDVSRFIRFLSESDEGNLIAIGSTQFVRTYLQHLRDDGYQSLGNLNGIHPAEALFVNGGERTYLLVKGDQPERRSLLSDACVEVQLNMRDYIISGKRPNFPSGGGIIVVKGTGEA